MTEVTDVSPEEQAAAPGAPAVADPTWTRLEESLAWYDRRSADNQRWYRGLKIAQLVAAAAVPVFAGLSASAWITGGLGSAIVVMEGVQQLYQFQERWLAYRSAHGALLAERHLYLARAGDYAAADSHALLAERVEGILSHELTTWGTQQRSTRAQGR
jgi:Protein of unknown function (DUF4231)